MFTDTMSEGSTTNTTVMKEEVKEVSYGDVSSETPAPDDPSSSEPKVSSSKARAIRLEQNRKAAKESRRRKKMMIEELQRSVIFFSRCNGSLKQQNDELSRLLLQAQAQVAAIESGQAPKPVEQQHPPPVMTPSPYPAPNLTQQVQAQAVATQAIFESQGFPPAAARAAAQTMNGSASAPVAASPADVAPTGPGGTPMQPGASMQAMANFQQAAAVAMQAAMGMNPAHAPVPQHHPPVPQFTVMAWQQPPQQQAQTQNN